MLMPPCGSVGLKFLWIRIRGFPAERELDLCLVSKAHMRRIVPHLPPSHGIAGVDDWRVISGIIYVVRRRRRSTCQLRKTPNVCLRRPQRMAF